MPVYRRIWDGPARVYRKDSAGRPVLTSKRYIVIHNTSNDATAEGEAAYAKVRTNASSHYYVDSNSIVQSLDTDWCAGHVGSDEGNTYGISYEITGFNGWTRAQWLSSVAWDLLAAQIAIDCKHFGIPVRLLTIAEMKTRAAKGFVTHDMCRIAWGGTTHTDPGPGFPMDHLMALVLAHLGGTRTGEDDIMLVKIEGEKDQRVWVSDGRTRRHLTSLAALNAAKAAGHRLVEVPTAADLEALAGPVQAPAAVRLSDEDRAAIVSALTAALPTAADLEAAAERAVSRMLPRIRLDTAEQG